MLEDPLVQIVSQSDIDVVRVRLLIAYTKYMREGLFSTKGGNRTHTSEDTRF